VGTITHMGKTYIKIVGLTEQQKRDIDIAASQAGMSLSGFCWKCIRLTLTENSPESIASWLGKVEPYPPKQAERRKEPKS